MFQNESLKVKRDGDFNSLSYDAVQECLLETSTSV